MALPQQLKWLWVILLFLPLVFTTKVQFSCYPLITNGELPQVCYQEPNISNVMTDIHTHGNVLYNLASKTSDESILRKLSSNLDITRVDYDSKTLQIELLGNKNTPPDLSESIFNKLIKDPTSLSETLLSKLALNPNTPDSILQPLILIKDDYTNYLISGRTQLSSATVALLFDRVKLSQSSYKYQILSNIASQENTSLEIMKILLEQAKKLELDKFEEGSECLIYEGLAKNPTLEDKLGSRNAKFISDQAQQSKKKTDGCGCKPKTRTNLGWGLGVGIAVITGVLVVGSGGLLAPIAIGAGAIAGGTAYVASQFLNKCP